MWWGGTCKMQNGVELGSSGVYRSRAPFLIIYNSSIFYLFANGLGQG